MNIITLSSVRSVILILNYISEQQVDDLEMITQLSEENIQKCGVTNLSRSSLNYSLCLATIEWL